MAVTAGHAPKPDAGGKIPLHIAVLTVSDTRTEKNDLSGDYLCAQLLKEKHILQDRRIVPDEAQQIRAIVAEWIADSAIQVVLLTGGTGFAVRDCTPEAVSPLLDKEIPGFGELFRYFSVQEIGSAAVQSRVFGGISGQTLIFCLPGSPAACRMGWEKILHEQLDSTWKPCNFTAMLYSGAKN